MWMLMFIFKEEKVIINIYIAGSLLKIEMNYLLDPPANLDNGIKCSTTFWLFQQKKNDSHIDAILDLSWNSQVRYIATCLLEIFSVVSVQLFKK